MLKILRKNMKWILWALIATFVIWGASSGIGSKTKGPDYAGKVFGRKVSFAEFSNAWEGTKNQGILMYGDAFATMARQMDLNSEVWNRIVLLNQAKREKIKVSSQEVVNAIAQVSFFQSGGKFDQAQYERVLEMYFKTTPRAFEDSIKDTLMIEKLQESVLRGVSVTPEEVRQEYEKTYQKTSISFVTVKISEFVPEIVVIDGHIKDFYDKNLRLFRKSEQVNISYVGPLDKETIDRISDKLLDKPDLAFAAKQENCQIKETGFFQMGEQIKDLGDLPDFSQVAFQLEEGQISNPFKTEKGYFIIYKSAVKPAYLMPFDEAKDAARQILINNIAAGQAKEASDKILSQINYALQKPDMTFDKVASEVGLSVAKAGPFTINDDIADLGPARQFEGSLFKLQEGQVSGALPYAKGYCIIKVDQIQPADETAFEKEKADFEKALLKKKRMVKYLNWYAQLMKDAAVTSNIGAQGAE